MANAPISKRYLTRYTNLVGWVKRNTALTRVSGKLSSKEIEFDGMVMTWDDFDDLFPDKVLIPAAIQLDGRKKG